MMYNTFSDLNISDGAAFRFSVKNIVVNANDDVFTFHTEMTVIIDVILIISLSHNTNHYASSAIFLSLKYYHWVTLPIYH